MENFPAARARYGSFDSITKVQIMLLNKAILIDSSYFNAYLNKFSFQNQLKLYKEAIVTGKQLMKLFPNDAAISIIVGENYERAGDSISARRHYLTSLSITNKQLAILGAKNKRRPSVEYNKAIALIMLGQQKDGHDLLLELYNNADERHKFTYGISLGKTRHQMIYGDTTSKSIFMR
jgi:tetratricopeptide (TPR) repeat protein